MREPIEVTLQPLTPLWTGDANQGGSRLRETGILGSLRWWYEALLRGLGHYACDPSSGSCVYDENTKLRSICLACQLFGCTGYSRRFRLTVAGGGGAGKLVEVKLRHPGRPDHRGWRIPPTVCGPLTLRLRPMRPDALGDFERAAMRHTICLVERYGALGAKTSHGQGAVKIIHWGAPSPVMTTDAWIGAVNTALKARPSETETKQPPPPTLSDFIGVTVTLDPAVTSRTDWWKAIPLTGVADFSLGSDPKWVPSAPAVRAQLRGWLRNNANFPRFSGDLRDDRHRLMGYVPKRNEREDARGSDVFVTHLYKADERWVMRIFAFVPCGDNAVDQGVRQLLSNRAGLESGVSSALGGLSVHVAPYPDTVQALLGEGGGSRD